MNVYAIINGINSVCALGFAVFVFYKKPHSTLQLRYGIFCLLLFGWTFSYLIWGFQTDIASSLYWLKVLLVPAVFIHIAHFHFTLTFINRVNKYRRLLIIGYLLSGLFLIIHLRNGFVDLSYVRHKPPFYYWPHASPSVSTWIITQLFFVGLSFLNLARAIKETERPHKARLKYFLAFNMIGWLGGLMNWFYFFDSTPIPPIGNAGITVYIVGTAYLIFKHDLLGLNIVIRRTFIYGTLSLLITLIYSLFIIVSERLFQTYAGYSSFFASLLAATTIALLFNPLRGLVANFIDSRFYGKSIEGLSNENERMRAELQQQDRMKAVATLAAGMAHEIKNPLTTIKTFIEYLPAKYDDPQYRDTCTRIVGDEVNRMNLIVGQLLNFSRPKSPQLKACSIEQILDDTLELLSNDFIKPKIEVIKRYAPLPSLAVDQNQFKQVFLNLFLNAIGAMPTGGTLTVATQISDRAAAIDISDTGVGITKEALPHIFDPFFTTGKETGTGLGLAIVYGIIKEHGGIIKVQSAHGSGTTFRIEIGVPG